MLSGNQYLLPLCKRWRYLVKYLSAEPETSDLKALLQILLNVS